MAILIGDVGGTNTRLALEGDQGSPAPERHRNAAFASFDAVLDGFLERQRPSSPIDAVTIAVAGPVLDGVARMTNLAWIIDTEAIGRRTGTHRVRLLNDLEAAAFALPHVPAATCTSLTPDVAPRRGTMGLVAPGTGLGEALLYFDGEHYHPMASEGGHADFGPQTDDDLDLLRYLRATAGGHVSWEYALAGPAIPRIARFRMETGRSSHDPQAEGWFAADDPSAAITASAMAGTSDLALATLDQWLRLLGAEAGNLALKGLTLGGVYLTGTIVEAVRPALASGPFLRSFRAKGRHTPLMGQIPVFVVAEPDLPLAGARHFARRLAHAMPRA